MTQVKCTHSRTVQRWKEDPPDPFDDDFINGEWVDHVEYTTIDLDLHRFKCTQCGEIMYYSSAARAYHEEGKLVNIDGLDK